MQNGSHISRLVATSGKTERLSISNLVFPAIDGYSYHSFVPVTTEGRYGRQDSVLIAMVAVGLLVILFAISNRTLVTLDLWPLPYTRNHGTLLSARVGGILAGFVGGAIVAWFSAGKIRRRARTAGKKVSGLEKNLDKLKQQIEDLESSRRAGTTNK